MCSHVAYFFIKCAFKQNIGDLTNLMMIHFDRYMGKTNFCQFHSSLLFTHFERTKMQQGKLFVRLFVFLAVDEGAR